jgi:hypothetical protein
MLFLRQKYWRLSFQEQRAYGLDIPKRLHMKRDIRSQKFLIMQGVDFCKIVWYKIVGVPKLTYMLYKFDNKWGCQFSTTW